MNNRLKILYIDDEQINLELFTFNFGRKYHVLLADSGKKGLKILQQIPDIKIVISDMKMPEMSGIEFIKRAKKMKPDIYFILLSAYLINNEIHKALDSGLINKYFDKPFDIEEMDNQILQVLTQS